MITSPALDSTGVDCRCSGTQPPHPPLHAHPHEGVAHASSDMSHFWATEWMRLEMLVDANVTIHGLLHCGGWARLWKGLPSIPLHRSRLEGEPRLHSLLLLLFVARDLHNSKHRMHTHQPLIPSPPRAGTDKRPARLCLCSGKYNLTSLCEQLCL